MTRIGDEYLTRERVIDTYGECMRPEGWSRPPRAVEVSSWMMRHTFSTKVLMKHRENIIRMLLCLPDGYRVDVKGGGLATMACYRASGTPWTADIADVERLIALGLGVNLVEFCMPRQEWHKVPGGVPFFRVMITRYGVSVN